MHIGRRYKASEFLYWTRRSIITILILSTIPVILYQVFTIRWIVIPWQVTALLGTATAFVVGFKNQQTYSRTWEARGIWAEIVAASRSWTLMCNNLIQDKKTAEKLIDQHLAWLTVLRYRLRQNKEWETIGHSYNEEYRQLYTIPESQAPLESVLEKFLGRDLLETISKSSCQLLLLQQYQTNVLKELNNNGTLTDSKLIVLYKLLTDFSVCQSKCEKIKDFPYPRQYATVNSLFVKLFCVLLPFSMLEIFDDINHSGSGFLSNYLIWMVIPFTALVGWVYTCLDQVGESTANPFEGSANDIPISQICRQLEMEAYDLTGRPGLAQELSPQNNIIL